MEEEKNKNKEECPFCEVSQETLNRLKKEGEEKKSQKEKSTKKKKGFWGKIFILILILGLVGFVYFKFFAKSLPDLSEGQVSGENSVSTQVGSFAPDFVSEDVFGNKISLSDFKNKKPVMLVFWATWCGSCAKELPDLKVFTAKYKNEIQVIAPDSGESRETLKNYIKEKDVNFLILLDEDRKIWNQYLVRGTPSHFLIDSQGKIVSLRPGLASKEDLEIMVSMLTELW